MLESDFLAEIVHHAVLFSHFHPFGTHLPIGTVRLENHLEITMLRSIDPVVGSTYSTDNFGFPLRTQVRVTGAGFSTRANGSRFVYLSFVCLDDDDGSDSSIIIHSAIASCAQPLAMALAYIEMSSAWTGPSPETLALVELGPLQDPVICEDDDDNCVVSFRADLFVLTDIRVAGIPALSDFDDHHYDVQAFFGAEDQCYGDDPWEDSEWNSRWCSA